MSKKLDKKAIHDILIYERMNGYSRMHCINMLEAAGLRIGIAVLITNAYYDTCSIENNEEVNLMPDLLEERHDYDLLSESEERLREPKEGEEEIIHPIHSNGISPIDKPKAQDFEIDSELLGGFVDPLSDD